MDRGVDRLRQLLKAGAPVYLGAPGEKTGNVRLLGIFPDGTKETIQQAVYVRTGTSNYKAMVTVLESAGIDVGSLNIRSRINVEWHVLEMPGGVIYRCLLPSIAYHWYRKI
ncbi:MAG: hypothetical protein HYS53_00740 [Candidatus Aenigmarchaeota archaeon]|nr:hypothetical protein [Candidatus Aenigmarchaeota archaeon]